MADREAVEAGHVLHPHGGQSSSEEIGPLVCGSCDERAAVGGSLDRESRGRSQVEFGDEVLGGGLKVVEYLLLLEGARAGVTPGDAVLAACVVI